MADPVNFEDYSTWPGQDLLEVRRSLSRAWHAMVIGKIAAMPVVWTSLAGEVLAVKSTENGATAASLAGVPAILFGNQPVRGFKAGSVALASSDTLTDVEHGGATIDMGNGSAAVLTVPLNANPAVGVSVGFTCEVIRLLGSAAVTITAGSGLTLRNPDGHTKVVDGGVARLRVHGANLYFWGYTEA